MARPIALVTNDDGIDSGFLHALAEALAKSFEIRIVAPANEQSWAGRSFTRHGTLMVAEHTGLPWPAWSVAGTPSDCVNLGLGRLLDEKPDVVVSGINMGFNVSLPLVMTSGTVAAAFEGSMWGLHAVAVSQSIPPEHFEAVKSQKGHVDGDLLTHLQNAAARAAQFTVDLLSQDVRTSVVHNLNFPAQISPETPMEETQLSNFSLGSLFAPQAENTFGFAFPAKREPIFNSDDSDVVCLRRGHISYTPLDYNRLGRSTD